MENEFGLNAGYRFLSLFLLGAAHVLPKMRLDRSNVFILSSSTLNSVLKCIYRIFRDLKGLLL